MGPILAARLRQRLDSQLPKHPSEGVLEGSVKCWIQIAESKFQVMDAYRKAR
jgi:hypothetical protein